MHVCLNMIVKDAESTIARALTSALPHIDSWCISDTGSTDNTCQIVCEFFAQHGVPGQLVLGKTAGFGEMRNHALDAAKALVCQIDRAYIVFLDADDELRGDDRVFVPGSDAYRFEVEFGDCLFERVQMIRARSKASWKYRIHETLVDAGSVSKGHLTLVAHPKSGEHVKYARWLELSEQDLADMPDDTRVVFYAAQNAYDARHFARAAELYAKRSRMGGWDEEVWYSVLRCAQANECQGSYQTAAADYVRADMLRPWRAEASENLARMFRQLGEPDAARPWAERASKIGFPPREDILFVQRGLYGGHELARLK